MRISRLRVVIRMDRDVQLQPHHGPLIYALLARANQMATNSDAPFLPDGILVEAPEQGRISVIRGGDLAFGWTLLSAAEGDARIRCQRLVDGLKLLGAERRSGGGVLNGNFHVVCAEDLVAGTNWECERPPAVIPLAVIDEQVAALDQVDEVELHFHQPLRMSRPKRFRDPGHAFFDERWFDSSLFLDRLTKRLQRLGAMESTKAGAYHAAQVSNSQLVWLDVPYGKGKQAKTLGGVVGSITLAGVPSEFHHLLVLGQYIGVGESCNFGFGQFSLPQLGKKRWECKRTISLLDWSLKPTAVDAAAARYAIASGEVAVAAEALRNGSYQPEPHTEFLLRSSHGAPRRLSVPSRRDRALQVAVLESVGSALDRFFESSSFAYRRGLGREKAAKRIEQVWNEGYRWAVRSDVHRFFDSVDHRELESRLAAYLPDPKLIATLMRWIEEGAPTPGRGLPTGAPISPVLANMFLDRLDEQVVKAGARLVRYADDFVILHKEESDALAALELAEQASKELQLQLNASKTSMHAPSEGFDFLGFRFEPRGGWKYSAAIPAMRLDQLGWHDRSKSAKRADAADDLLPGEGRQFATGGTVAILAPRIVELSASGRYLTCHDRVGSLVKNVPARNLNTVVAQSQVDLHRTAMKLLVEENVSLWILGPSGRVKARLLGPRSGAPASALQQQVKLSLDANACTFLASKLVRAKIFNTYVLCRKLFPDPEGMRVAERLRQAAIESQRTNGLEQLRGVEGAAAGAWYGLYGRRLPDWLRFDRRHKPRAHDPANAMLNILHSHLYRLNEAAADAAGLSPRLGILHRSRGTHAALASDLQEPFRHLVDRVVWSVASSLSARDFQPVEGVDYPIRIRPPAMRTLMSAWYRVLALGCESASQTTGTYSVHIFRQARQLRRALTDPTIAFEPFIYP